MDYIKHKYFHRRAPYKFRSMLRLVSCLVSAAAIFIICQGCSTGVESTKTIKYSKSERRQLAPTPEETMMSALVSSPLSEWLAGKQFLVSDSKANLVFDASSVAGQDENMEGMVLEYGGTFSRITPGGAEEAVIEFKSGNRTYIYSTGKDPRVAASTITGMDIPMLIDLDMVDKAASLLVGKKVWTRSRLWYDGKGNKIAGRKFVPVVIKGVAAGTMVFPLKIDIEDEHGLPAVLYMNAGNGGVESRTFQTLFSLSDPRERYQSVLPEVWDLIKEGKVRLGMSKEECKLSLGNPVDVNSGHDWNSTIDFWQYPDGTFLRFQDGLLVDFRN